MIVLDTNVVSEFTGEGPVDPHVRMWLDDQIPEDLAITAVTVGEMLSGIATMSPGRRRDRIQARTFRVLVEVFDGRALPFDIDSARHIGPTIRRSRRSGRP